MITDSDPRVLFFHDQRDQPVLRCATGGEAELARAAVASASTARVRRISDTALAVTYADGMDPHRRLNARGFRVRQDPSIPYRHDVPIERSYRREIAIAGYDPSSTLTTDSEVMVTVHSRDELPLQLTMAGGFPFVAVEVLGVLADEGFLVTDEADDLRPGMAFGDLWLQSRGTAEELRTVLAAHGIAAAVAVAEDGHPAAHMVCGQQPPVTNTPEETP